MQQKTDFRVSLSYVEEYDQLLQLLESHGYQANRYERDWIRPISDCLGIWIGHKIPYQYAIEVIQLAKKIWPELCYLELTSSMGKGLPPPIHKEICIGSSTKSAKENGLKIWTLNDFEQLTSEITEDRFNSLIASKSRS